MQEYEVQIASLQSALMPALPAPAKSEDELAEIVEFQQEPETEVSQDTEEERAPAHAEGEVEVVAFRAKLKGKKRDLAFAAFRESVGFHLSADHGIDIDNAAPSDLEELERHFADGLTAEQAAEALMAERPGQLEAAE